VAVLGQLHLESDWRGYLLCGWLLPASGLGYGSKKKERTYSNARLENSHNTPCGTSVVAAGMTVCLARLIGVLSGGASTFGHCWIDWM
jgi:hypothetical protein